MIKHQLKENIVTQIKQVSSLLNRPQISTSFNTLLAQIETG